MIIRPYGFLISPEVSRIHGITTARAKLEGIALDSALQQLALDVQTYKPVSVAAHNLDFDRPIVEAEYELLGMRSPLSGLDGVCTLRLSRNHWPDQPASLGNVYQRLFGLPLEKAHDAQTDVSACMRIFFALQSALPTQRLNYEALDIA
jgi:DNA polymerase III epsilon subunit-like protein